jgi:hypothetical protein
VTFRLKLNAIDLFQKESLCRMSHSMELSEIQSGTIIKDVFVKSIVMADDPRKKAADRRFVSQQPHEQAYQRRKNKQSGKNSGRKTGRSRGSK